MSQNCRFLSRIFLQVIVNVDKQVIFTNAKIILSRLSSVGFSTSIWQIIIVCPRRHFFSKASKSKNLRISIISDLFLTQHLNSGKPPDPSGCDSSPLLLDPPTSSCFSGSSRGQTNGLAEAAKQAASLVRKVFSILSLLWECVFCTRFVLFSFCFVLFCKKSFHLFHNTAHPILHLILFSHKVYKGSTISWVPDKILKKQI